MRVLKTFVILDIVLYITGVTSFKCISVLLTKFLVGLEYIPSFTLTWNSSPAPVLCPPIRPRPPPPRAHDLQQEHVLDCRSHLQRSGKPFQCGMSISFSHFLWKKDRQKSSEGDKRMQSAVRLGGPGHALGLSRGLGEAASLFPFSGFFRRC